MTTEYIGEAFRPIFNVAMAAWWAGNCEGLCPMENWESKPVKQNIWFVTESSEPPCESGIVYRFKPAPKRTVVIGYIRKDGDWNGKELVAPETVAPECATNYFDLFDSNLEQLWYADTARVDSLREGRIFLTREDAQAMSDWTAKCRGGGA